MIRADASAVEIEHMPQTFAERDCVVVPGLFSTELLDHVHGEMERATFDARDYESLAGG